MEKGIELYKAAHPKSSANDTFTTTWLPFYLDPTSPKVGVDKKARYEERFGKDNIAPMQERLTHAGKQVGINFKFGGKIGNTRDSHRLIQLAKLKEQQGQTGIQNKVVEALFSGYFENEKDITSHEFLQEAGVAAGLDPAEVREWLASDKGGREVDAEVEHAQDDMVTGVPNFVLQNKYEVRGAQDAEGFKRVFEKIKKMEGEGLDD
jgi:predicted DsbA family dithiol-disulfide isomerase